MVGVGIHVDGGARESGAIDEACVVELVRIDGIVWAGEGGDSAQICVVAAVEKKGRFGPEPLRQGALQAAVSREVSGDEARGASTCAEGGERSFGGGGGG